MNEELRVYCKEINLKYSELPNIYTVDSTPPPLVWYQTGNKNKAVLVGESFTFLDPNSSNFIILSKVEYEEHLKNNSLILYNKNEVKEFSSSLCTPCFNVSFIARSGDKLQIKNVTYTFKTDCSLFILKDGTFYVQKL